MPKPKIRTIKIIGKNGEQISMPMPDTDNPDELKQKLKEFIKQQKGDHDNAEESKESKFKSVQAQSGDPK